MSDHIRGGGGRGVIATCTVVQRTENRVLAHLSRVADREVLATG
ncbi:MAG: hypothetical protein ACXQTN_03255 [Methanoculleaceae archaeon]